MYQKLLFQARPLSFVALVISALLLSGIASYGAEPSSLGDIDDDLERYPKNTLSKRTGGDLYGNIPADRALGLKDLDLLLKLSDFLTDRRNADVVREWAAEDLGRLGHQYGIPALLAVVRDEDDALKVRMKSLIALSQIKDKRVVEYLIDHGLSASDSNMVHQADWQLRQITGRQDAPPAFVGLEFDPKDPYRKSYQRNWREWWKNNRKHVRLDRDAAFTQF